MNNGPVSSHFFLLPHFHSTAKGCCFRRRPSRDFANGKCVHVAATMADLWALEAVPASVRASAAPDLRRSRGMMWRSGAFAARRPEFVSFGSDVRFAGGMLGHQRSVPSMPKQGQRLRRSSCVVRASASAADPSPGQMAPLQLESPVGQFLSQILVSHPHLLPAAVDQQLEQLQTDRDAEKLKEEPSTSGTDLVLYRRIAEVKASERKTALEEILYALVVQKFMDASVSLVPALSQSTDPSGRVDQWPPQGDKLEKLHSPEAYEMIQNHLAIILGNRTVDANTTAVISKLRVGQVYAASVMYGYFLKRVDQRFQLEKTMKTLPWSSEGEDSTVKQMMPDESRPSVQAGSLHPEVSAWSASPEFNNAAGQSKPSRMRSYVMSLDPETLHSYATVRSKEAFSIIEKHTEALFGRPEVVITPQGTIDTSKDQVIKISFSGLRRLILEAVTFGSFLWDVESYVDSRYHFVAN